LSRSTAAIAAALVFAAAACRAPAPAVGEERIVTDRARGVRFVVPPGWREADAEIRSPSGSLLTLRVFDLVEADKAFVAGLPDTLLPQLKEWAELYYIVLGPPTRSATTVNGVPATELVYPTRVRKKDPPSKVVYWVVIRKTRLFVLRAAFPAANLAIDEPVLRKIVGGWVFLDTAE
jgi:hypothetical protein